MIEFIDNFLSLFSLKFSQLLFGWGSHGIISIYSFMFMVEFDPSLRNIDINVRFFCTQHWFHSQVQLDNISTVELIGGSSLSTVIIQE